MSTFSTSFRDGAADNMLEEFGDAGRVRYKVAGQSPVSLIAVVGRESKERMNIGGETRVVRAVPITISTDPAGVWGGVAEPKTTDTVELDGRDYPIRSVGNPIGGLIDLKIELPSLQEHSRPNRRGR